MKIVKRILIVLILLIVGFFALLYWGTYEKGVMAGKILRISEKGYVFKTYEAKLSIESFGALKGTSPIAETFDFSVSTKQDSIVKQLQEVALTGERVNIHYIKRYIRVPWRGSTKYFAVEVERVKRK
ncbi:MAG TPA: hypothetical protein PLH91_05605 [Tenuifilaceae bacterium]|nr:hypothetical protein [Tenuifilaceae bacterium]HPI44685.1 hypothetical protein [Tenuifilaceae bacterium]HPN20552.1 hypothetical protein [Tenuifilaceae bacterium]